MSKDTPKTFIFSKMVLQDLLSLASRLKAPLRTVIVPMEESRTTFKQKTSLRLSTQYGNIEFYSFSGYATKEDYQAQVSGEEETNG